MDKEKYQYVQGIADMVAKMGHPQLTYIDYEEDWTSCQYCNAAVKWKFFITDIKPTTTIADLKSEFFVGSECIKHFMKYIGMEKWKLDRALSYFNKYQELCRELKTRPSAKIEIEKLEKEVYNLRAEMEKKKQEEVANQLPKVKRLDALTNADSPFRPTSWETEFINSVVGQHYAGSRWSEKQVAIIDKILAQYDATNLPADYLEKLKKENEAKEAQRREDRDLINSIMDCRLSLYDRPFISSLAEWIGKGRPLSEKQRAAALKVAEKYSRQIRDRNTLSREQVRANETNGLYEPEDSATYHGTKDGKLLCMECSQPKGYHATNCKWYI